MLEKKWKKGRNAPYLSLILILAIFIIGVACRITARSANADSLQAAPAYKYYTSIVIEGGDSLWSIAQEHMTAEYANIYDYMDEIREINHISGDFIKSGSYLCIPYYSAEYKP